MSEKGDETNNRLIAAGYQLSDVIVHMNAYYDLGLGREVKDRVRQLRFQLDIIETLDQLQEEDSLS